MGLAGSTVSKSLAAPAGGSDNFNRASLGALWVVDSGAWDISGNRLHVPGFNSNSRIHYDSLLPANHSSQITFIGGPGDRIQVHGVYTHSQGYFAGWSGFARWYIIRDSPHPSIGTVLAQFNSAPINAGDVFKLESIGSTHNFYVNGVLKLTANDSTYTGAGYAGVCSDPAGDGSFFDDFVCAAA
jgi:hypothetical protein